MHPIGGIKADSHRQIIHAIDQFPFAFAIEVDQATLRSFPAFPINDCSVPRRGLDRLPFALGSQPPDLIDSFPAKLLQPRDLIKIVAGRERVDVRPAQPINDVHHLSSGADAMLTI